MKKTIWLSALGALVLQLNSASAVLAGFYGAPGGALLTAVGRLEPWFTAMDKRFETRVNQSKAVKSFKSGSASLVCSFALQRGGQILNPKVEKTSGIHELDEAILSAVKNTSIDECPNNVPMQRGVYCDVTVIDGKAKIFSHLNPHNRQLYFKVEYYSKNIPVYNLRAGSQPSRQ